MAVMSLPRELSCPARRGMHLTIDDSGGAVGWYRPTCSKARPLAGQITLQIKHRYCLARVDCDPPLEALGTAAIEVAADGSPLAAVRRFP